MGLTQKSYRASDNDIRVTKPFAKPKTTRAPDPILFQRIQHVADLGFASDDPCIGWRFVQDALIDQTHHFIAQSRG